MLTCTARVRRDGIVEFGGPAGTGGLICIGVDGEGRTWVHVYRCDDAVVVSVPGGRWVFPFDPRDGGTLVTEPAPVPDIDPDGDSLAYMRRDS